MPLITGAGARGMRLIAVIWSMGVRSRMDDMSGRQQRRQWAGLDGGQSRGNGYKGTSYPGAFSVQTVSVVGTWLQVPAGLLVLLSA